MTSGIRTKADIDSDQCMLYAGSLKTSGYPKSPNTIIRRYGNQAEDLHRFIYMIEVGELIQGMVIDHICENKSCINSDHLQQVTIRENVTIKSETSVSALNFRKTNCKHGHSRWGIRPVARRYCLECTRLRSVKNNPLTQERRNELRRLRKIKERMLICA